MANEVHRRANPGQTYLYMLLVSLYTYAIYATTWWQRLVNMVLVTLLSLAFWQKARDRIPFLLDPTAAPPPRVSLADGLIAAVVFSVVQAIVAIFYKTATVGETLLIAFLVAGSITYLGARVLFWWAGILNVPRAVGPSAPQAIRWGFAGGVAASVVGLAYVRFAANWLIPETSPPDSSLVDHVTWPWLYALAIFAAPVFEEFIFRGLVFQGLRRSTGLVAATLGSAGIFAIVHPPFAFVPVFTMAVVAALVFERTKILAGPIVVHAVYNASVLTFAWIGT